MRNHARQQVLDYFQALLQAEVGVHCDIHRVSPIPKERKESLNLLIDDESTGGDDAADEFEDTLGVMSRVAPMVVEISVMTAVPHRRINELSALVESALAGIDGEGDHVIKGAQCSSQYVAMSAEQDGEGQVDQVTTSLIFQTSYRTEAGNPFDLV